MKRLIIIFLVLFFSNTVFAKSDRLYSDTELDALKARLNSKLESNLSSYLGKIKFSIFLNFKTKEVKTKGTSKEINSLYLLEQQNIESEKPLQNLVIQNISVKVIVYERLKNALNKEIESIVKSTLGDYSTTVNVSYLESTRTFYDLASNESSDFVTYVKTMLNRHVAEVMRLIGVALIALVILVVAWLLKSPLNSMASSFKSMSLNKNNPPPSPSSVEQKPEVPSFDPHHTSKIFKEGLIHFKKLFALNPLEVGKVILESEENAAGVKKLLPYFYEQKSLTLIRESFTDLHFEKINKTQFQFNNQIDFLNWLEKTNEVLSLSVVSKRKNILHCISEDQLQKIKLLSAPSMKKYLEISRSPLAYQIFLDVAEEKVKLDLLKDFDLDEWKIIIDIKDVTSNEISDEVIKIINSSPDITESKAAISSLDIQNSLVVPSIINILSLKKLKVQDEFLDSLAAISSEAVESIREKVWTPRSVLSVPATTLKDVFREYDINQKAKIIHSMPLDVGEFLINSAIDGKIKIIVEDLVKNPKDAFTDDSAEAVGLGFLNDLHGAYLKGKFSLSVNSNLIDATPKGVGSDENEMPVDELDVQEDKAA